MEKRYDEEIEIDVIRILYELKRKLWIIVILTLLGGTAAAVFSAQVMVPKYCSTSMVCVIPNDNEATSLTDLQIGSQVTEDYIILYTSRPVLNGVIRELNLGMNDRELREKITVENPVNTRLLKLTVEDTDPMTAKILADRLAENGSQYIGSIMEITPPKVIEAGELPIHPSSPNILKNTAIAAAACALSSGAVFILRIICSDTVQSEEDVENYLKLPNLAVVPEYQQGNGKEKKRKRKRKQRAV